MDLILSVIVPGIIGLVLLVVIGVTFSRLYKRAEKDRAYVRTGLGGQKVVLDGGAIILPVFQAIRWVNLQTLRLEVRRETKDALITKDRMRVDIGADFYVRVKPDAVSIGLAAQTLGDRTNSPEMLRELVEAKFVDALRSVAATMSMTELQENRAEFVKAVQKAVATDLELNGLELEAASLTRLDQTKQEYFDPSNAFDAEGLAALTKITEAKRQERNEIKNKADVAIAQQNLEAAQQTLEIERQKQDATLSQQRDIANKTAATRAETAQQEAEAQRAEAEARITTEQTVALREAEAKQTKEQAQINADLTINQRRIQAERDTELAGQEKAIALANRSRDESQARAEAEKARALAVASEEAVTTAKDVAIAERGRQIAVIAAKQEAEQEATKITVAAEAEKQAAEDKASAVRVAAEAEAEAAKLKAAGQAATYDVEAEGQRKINEARNLLSPALIEFEITQARLKIIPEALAQAVRPLDKIGEVKIIDMGGGIGGANGSAAGANRSDSLVNQLMQYRAQSPIIDALLKEAGFTAGGNPIEALMAATKDAGKANGTIAVVTDAKAAE